MSGLSRLRGPIPFTGMRIMDLLPEVFRFKPNSSAAWIWLPLVFLTPW
jgi:hypothetical protein